MGSVNDAWWKVESTDDGVSKYPSEIYIYTEQIGIVESVPLKPMATYEKMPKKNSKDKAQLIAYQYKVEEGSKEQKDLFKLLKLTNEQEKNKKTRKSRGSAPVIEKKDTKTKRTRRTKAQMAEARAKDGDK